MGGRMVQNVHWNPWNLHELDRHMDSGERKENAEHVSAHLVLLLSMQQRIFVFGNPFNLVSRVQGE